MGNNPITFDDNVVIVQDGVGKTVSEYCLTPWLMDLVFNKKLPMSPPREQDVDNYKDMLMATQSAYINNDVKQGTKGSCSNKHVGLISKPVKNEGGQLRGVKRGRGIARYHPQDIKDRRLQHEDRRPQRYHEDEEDFGYEDRRL